MRDSHRRGLCLTLIVSAALLAFLPGAVASRSIDWLDRIPPALADAQARRVPVLVNVWAGWVLPCREMARTTYRDQRVLREMESFVAAQIDVDTDKNFRWQYRLEEYPSVLFLDDTGAEITRLSGAISAPILLDRMQRVIRGYPAYLDARTRESADAHIQLGTYFAEIGNPDGAVDHFEAALEGMQNQSGYPVERLRLRLAEALEDCGKLDQAAEVLTRLSNDATSPGIVGLSLAALARIERARGNDDKAEALSARIEKEFPHLAR